MRPPRSRPAQYRDQSNPLYRDNPWIETLEERLTDDQAFDQLHRSPKYPPSPECLRLDGEDRIALVWDLATVYEPLSKSLQVHRHIDRLLRNGYVHRNPLDPEYPELVDLWAEFARSEGPDSLPTFLHTPRAQPIAAHTIGPSGMGKSMTIDQVLGRYEQVRVHSQYGDVVFPSVQLVWLNYECPSDVSLKSLCVDLCREVDDLLGTRFTQMYVKSGASAEVLSGQVIRMFSYIGLGLLVVDEIQNVSRRRSGGSERVLNFLVRLTNRARLPVIFVGTPQATDILTSKLRMARRGCPDIYWWPMAHDTEFRAFCEALWQYQYVHAPCALSQDHLDQFYFYSCGITSLVKWYFIMAQTRAIESGVETITPRSIALASTEDFESLQPILEAIRQGDDGALELLGDVLPQTLSGIAVKQAPRENRRTRKTPPQQMAASPLRDLATQIDGDTETTSPHELLVGEGVIRGVGELGLLPDAGEEDE